MPLYGSTYISLFYLSTMCFHFSTSILCLLGVIFLSICCMLVLRNKYVQLFTVLTIYFSHRKHTLLCIEYRVDSFSCTQLKEDKSIAITRKFSAYGKVVV